MTRIAVTTLGPAELLRGASLPIPAGRSYAMQSRGIISGSPGTMPIPAPPPAGIPQDKTGLAQGNHDSRSSDSPNVWFPAIYYEAGTLENTYWAGGTVSVFSDNQMPMPAINPLGPPAAGAGANQPASQKSVPPWVGMGRPRLGGQYSVPNRAQVPYYRNLGG